MNSPNAFRWLLPIAPLLVLSVAWKIAVPWGTAIPPTEHEPKNALIDIFERKDFVVSEQMVGGVSVIQAKAKSCRLQVASLTSDASDRDLARRLSEGADRYFIVFHGRVYMQQPVLWTVLTEIWSISLRNLGLISHVPRVIAVAASQSCDAEQVPWDELRQLS